MCFLIYWKFIINYIYICYILKNSGAGVVNCQYGVGPWEKFHLQSDVKEIYSIESVQFSGVFLRMDGNGVTQPTGPGGGIVNCQYGAFPYEMFRLHFL